MANSPCLSAATPHHAPDLHVVGRVEKRHRRLLVAEQTIQVRTLACISTQQAMRPELPEVSRLAHRRERQPVGSDAIRRICRVLLKITDQLVDLDRLEAGDGDVEAFLNEELGELGEFDGESLPVPAGILGDFVVGNQQARFCASLKPGSVMAGIFLRPRSFAASSRPCPASSTEFSSISTGTVKP